MSRCTGRKSLCPAAPDLARRSLHSNPASSAKPPRPASSNIFYRMLPLSWRPAIAKPHLPSLSCLRLLTSLLPVTVRSLRTPSPSLPPPCTDSFAVPTTAKEKTTPNLSLSIHLIGQQPTLTTSPLISKTFYQQIIPYYLKFYHLYQLSPSYLHSDVW